MSKPIREVMTEMPYTIESKASLKAAEQLMAKHSCHHLPVMAETKLVGILSDQDLRENEQNPENLKVEDLMTSNPVAVDPKNDAFQVAMLMHEKKIGSVIVSATPYSPWGIFTSTDAIRFLNKSK